ncbi:MAG: preprotein translocase subunit YajC [Candidatus Omnitrophica bacterium]|nr:preprotein translocase subunit YajC [Candidatus Omnitrophota bacterium]
MQNNSTSGLYNLIFPALLFIIIYFLIIKPQRQQQKEHQKMLGNLAKNDEVITSGGIHGTVVNIKDKTVIIRVDDNVRLELEKNCIVQVAKKGAA